MAKTVKIGFIGAGGIGRYQMEKLSKMAGVEIVAAADVTQASLDMVKEKYGVQKLFTDWKKMLALKELDAVSVCTPNGMHCAPTVAALKAGKHVLVEKPLAMNATEGAQMVAAAKASKKLLQIAFQWRFSPAAQFLRKQVQSGKLGDILYVRCQALRRRGIPNWGVFGRKDLQGGGPMIDIGVHILEVAHYVMGAPTPVAARGACHTYLGNKKSEALTAWDNWDYKTYTVEDLATGYISFKNGASLVIESSFAAHIEKDVFSFQIMGTKGGANFDPVQVYTDDNGYMTNVQPAFLGNWDMFEYKMKHFVECIRDGKKCDATGEDGLQVQKMLDAIYASSEQKKEIIIK